MCVYFIQNKTNLNIKIGYSKNPSERLAQLCTATSDQLDLLLTIEGGIEREKELHRLFRDHHVAREWFAPSEQIVEFIKENTVMSKKEQLDMVKKDAIEASYKVIGHFCIFENILHKMLLSDTKNINEIKIISVLKSTINYIYCTIENLSSFINDNNIIDDNYLFNLNKDLYLFLNSLYYIEQLLFDSYTVEDFYFNEFNHVELGNIHAIRNAISEELNDVKSSGLLKSIKDLYTNIVKIVEFEYIDYLSKETTQVNNNNLIPFKNAA